MSPTEASLRAALRDGEGEGVDADVIITRALRLRLERRRQWRTAAASLAAAAVVGGIAVGISQTSGDDSAASSANARSEAGVNYNSSAGAAAGGGSGAAPAPTARAAAGAESSACPARPLPSTGPGGRTPGQLFARTPASIIVCGYLVSNGQSVVVGSTVRGATARRIATALESSELRGDSKLCKRGGPDYELLPRDSLGRPLDPVSLTPGCEAYAVTNGAVTRYVPVSSPVIGLIGIAAQVRPDQLVPPSR